MFDQELGIRSKINTYPAHDRLVCMECMKYHGSCSPNCDPGPSLVSRNQTDIGTVLTQTLAIVVNGSKLAAENRATNFSSVNDRVQCECITS